MIPACYLDAIRSRLPEDSLIVGATTPAEGLRWAGGPIDAILVDRAVVGDPSGSVTAAWVMHLATRGILAFYGWTPDETPDTPALRAWRGVDGRLFVPVEYEGMFAAYQCVGGMADF